MLPIRITQGILNNLSEEAISQPMSQGTIFKIQEELDGIVGKKLLEFCEFEMGSPQYQCNESSEYSNRGNRRANAGMIEAALADFNKAILLKPGDFLPLWNRALMFMENDMTGLAFQDALTIYENIMKPENNLQLAFKWLNLSTMLMNLNKPFYSISLILKCLKDFNKYQVPYITENNGHFLYIEIKEKCWYNDVDLDSFNEIVSTVKELDLKHNE